MIEKRSFLGEKGAKSLFSFGKWQKSAFFTTFFNMDKIGPHRHLKIAIFSKNQQKSLFLGFFRALFSLKNCPASALSSVFDVFKNHVFSLFSKSQKNAKNDEKRG
jgi:hypothetical protein